LTSFGVASLSANHFSRISEMHLQLEDDRLISYCRVHYNMISMICQRESLWLLAVVANHFHFRYEQMILRRSVTGRVAIL
jgi:hypothetical protein